MYRHRHLARQPASAAILPRRLRVHSSLGRRDLLVFLSIYQRKQPPNLPVCDQSASASTHRNPLGLIFNVREFCSSPVGLSYCRPSHQPISAIVAAQPDTTGTLRSRLPEAFPISPRLLS